MEEIKGRGIGEILKGKRAARKISLAEAQAATKISKKYLQALEDDNFKAIPTEVAVKGFLKIYAEYLGLEGANLIAQYNSLMEPSEKAILREPKKISKWEYLRAKVGSNYLVYLIAAIFLVFVLGYGLSLSFKRHTPKTLRGVGIATLEAEEMKGVILDVESNERAWIYVEVDGKETFSGVLEKGQKLSWSGRKKIKIKTGNAHGISVTCNGKVLGPLGSSGMVVEKEFFPE